MLEGLQINWPTELNNKICYIYKTGNFNISIFVGDDKEPTNKIEAKYSFTGFYVEKIYMYVHSNLYIFSCKAMRQYIDDLQILKDACDFS